MKDKWRLIWMVIKSDVCAVISIIDNIRTVAHNMDIDQIKQSAEHLLETVDDKLQQEENVKFVKND